MIPSWMVTFLELPIEVRAPFFALATAFLFLFFFAAPWFWNSDYASIVAYRKTLTKDETPTKTVAPVQNVNIPAQVDSAQAPAPIVQQFTGGFNVVNIITNNITIPDGGPVEKQELKIASKSGGTAQVEVYLLFKRASWGFGRFDSFVDTANRRIDLSTFLDSDAFAKQVPLYDAIVCLGLGSGSSTSTQDQGTRLVDDRATHLCGIISRKSYIGKNTRIFGLPLGKHLDPTTKMSKQEVIQRSIIILGIKSTTGDLAELTMQQKMVSEIIHRDQIKDFSLGRYSEVSSPGDLRYIEVRRGVFPRGNAH
jgi:hypothetical protein